MPVHAINLACDDPEVMALFNSADLVFCDGQGLSLMLRALGLGHFPQLTYNRYMPQFFEFCAQRGYRIFFLGSTGDVIEQARP